jgi:hypothetical protein
MPMLLMVILARVTVATDWRYRVERQQVEEWVQGGMKWEEGR